MLHHAGTLRAFLGDQGLEACHRPRLILQNRPIVVVVAPVSDRGVVFFDYPHSPTIIQLITELVIYRPVIASCGLLNERGRVLKSILLETSTSS